MKRILFVATLVVALLSCASTFGTVTIDTVPVGDAGNAADGLGHGSVSYSYRIGKYEVTNGQYVEFLNGVDSTGANALSLYNPGMTSTGTGGIIFDPAASSGQKYQIKPGRGNNPVVLVSWYDSVRFANWMQNGQGQGDTEHGAYTLVPQTCNCGVTSYRNAGAQWFLPNYDEWYKAAYLKNDGSVGGSWLYPTANNRAPLSTPPPGISNSGNISSPSGTSATTGDYFDPTVNYLTDVGAYKYSGSPYGTFDQAGNVWEWDDGAAKLGGGFLSQLIDMTRNYSGSRPIASYEDFDAGFRLATIAVPEATTLSLALVAAGMLPCMRGRRQMSHNRR